MEPIGNIGQMAEILRKRLLDTQKAGAGASKTTGDAKTAAATGRPGIDELKQTIREKLARIDPKDRKAGQKSTHVFLESVLLWEFGEGLRNDPKFYALLDEIQCEMEGDAGVRENLAALMTSLK
ncbi:MAG: hypothetical protein V4632_13665 [Pseudomonadota bacterium]